jgi:mannose-1-phosphate guanylyltransferase
MVPSISVDYAIMERASGIALVPAKFRWNDLGSWQSLLEVGSVDRLRAQLSSFSRRSPVWLGGWISP